MFLKASSNYFVGLEELYESNSNGLKEGQRQAEYLCEPSGRSDRKVRRTMESYFLQASLRGVTVSEASHIVRASISHGDAKGHENVDQNPRWGRSSGVISHLRVQ